MTKDGFLPESFRGEMAEFAKSIAEQESQKMANLYNKNNGWTTSSSSTMGYDTASGGTMYINVQGGSGSKTKKDPEPDGPLEWLDKQVEETCKRGREAMEI